MTTIRRRFRRGACRVLPAAAGAAFASSTFAQASYQQGFDNLGGVGAGQYGPSGLISQGYIFRNQSQPIGSGYWFESTGFSHSGTGNISVNTTVGSGPSPGGLGSAWMILPPIPNQIAGDALKFFHSNSWSVLGNYAHLEVRYSPSGSTGTGSGASDVGDFTSLIADIAAQNGQPWTPESFVLPGGGRVAFRYVQPLASSSTMMGDFQIDTLTVGVPNLGFPLPDPGQTVHWTTAISPVSIGTDIIIPAGGTVVVDPGVEVIVAPVVRVQVEGTLDAREGTRFLVPTDSQLNIHGVGVFAGTPTSRVKLEGGAAWFGGDNGYQVKHTGRVSLSHVDLSALVKHAAYIYITGGGLVTASDVAVTGPEAGFYIDHGTLAIRNASFGPGTVLAGSEAYLLVDQITMNGARFQSQRYHAGQPIYLNRIAATGSTTESPFLLAGFDHFFGPDNTISGNLYPVHLTGGGIAPGSTLPASGNQNNYVHAGIGEIIGRATFANTGLFYRIDWDSSVPWMGGDLLIEPGVTVRLGPDAYLWPTYGSNFSIKGLPDAPIVFERFDPNQAWQSITYSINRNRPKLEHVVVRGSELGVIADETVVRVEESLFENNLLGALGSNWGQFVARKSRFVNNQTGVRTSYGLPGSGFGAGHVDLDGITNPNSFEGNGVAFDVLNPQNIEEAPNNWWGHPSGPTHPSNPGGTGQVAQGFGAQVVPFRTTPPNFADRPPRVRMQPHSWLMDGGAKIVLSWEAEDDGSITGYRVLFSGHDACYALQPVLTGIPGTARSVELVVPAYVPSNCIDPAVLRVEATDDSGQIGYDEIMYFTPNNDFQGTVVPNPITGPLRPGQTVDVCYQVLGGASGGTDAYLFLEDQDWAMSLGGAHTGVTCLSLGLTAPPVSTDMARVGIRYGAGAGGRDRWEFTPYFAIRPDPAVGDAPPVIQMTSPAAGQSFPGGGTVPVAWTASDDEALRSFDVQASYDAGRTWHTLARDLPPTATSFGWKLPPGTGIPGARVRVIARDLRFQASSSGGNVPFTIAPGSLCYADCTGDGQLSVADFGCFQTKFVAGDPSADCNTDGSLTVADFGCFQSAFVVGCP